MNIAEIRQKFPMYDDVPDGALVRGLHKKFYSDIPYGEFLQKIDFREAAPDPTEGMSGAQKFGAGAGKAFVDVGRGVGQLAGAVPQEEIDEARRLDAPLMDTGAGIAGNIAGNIGALAPAAAIPGVNSVVGAGALGGLFGFAQPVATDESRLKNTAFNAVGGMVIPGGVRSYQLAKAAAKPFYEAGREQIVGGALRRAVGDDPATLARMASADELVPGSQPTAAEVSGNANIAAMQRMAAQADPEAYAARAAQQNEARKASLFDLAGTSGEREFHASARDAAAKKLYDDAYVAGADIRRDAMTGQFRTAKEIQGVRGEITKLLKRPAVQEAAKRARKLAANEGEQIKNPFASVKGMDYTKRALDDMIEEASGNDARILKAVKDRLLTTVDRLSPKYALARKTFREQSRPINQMDVAQEVADKSVNKLSGKLEPAAFARALSDDTAARATGSRAATLANTLDPNRLARLEAIKADLARSTEAANLGRGPGSNTFQNLAMANMLEQSGVPAAMRGMTIPQVAGGLIGRAGNAIYADADRQMRERLAELLLNPREAARLMRPGRQLTEKQKRLVEALRFSSSAAPIGAVSATVE